MFTLFLDRPAPGARHAAEDAAPNDHKRHSHHSTSIRRSNSNHVHSPRPHRLAASRALLVSATTPCSGCAFGNLCTGAACGDRARWSLEPPPLVIVVISTTIGFLSCAQLDCQTDNAAAAAAVATLCTRRQEGTRLLSVRRRVSAVHVRDEPYAAYGRETRGAGVLCGMNPVCQRIKYHAYPPPTSIACYLCTFVSRIDSTRISRMPTADLESLHVYSRILPLDYPREFPQIPKRQDAYNLPSDLAALPEPVRRAFDLTNKLQRRRVMYRMHAIETIETETESVSSSSSSLPSTSPSSTSPVSSSSSSPSSSASSSSSSSPSSELSSSSSSAPPPPSAHHPPPARILRGVDSFRALYRAAGLRHACGHMLSIIIALKHGEYAKIMVAYSSAHNKHFLSRVVSIFFVKFQELCKCCLNLYSLCLFYFISSDIGPHQLGRRLHRTAIGRARGRRRLRVVCRQSPRAGRARQRAAAVRAVCQGGPGQTDAKVRLLLCVTEDPDKPPTSK
jgi:hypothetical protein